MRNDKLSCSHSTISRQEIIHDFTQPWHLETAALQNVDEGPNLKVVKDIAELWLQADLDKRHSRKAELEKVLSDTLARAGRDIVDPIGKIFQHVILGSTRKTI
jgi:hypothetical protein